MIVNKVAESGIITLDLSTFLPDEKSILPFDLKPFLFRELILREKDFREALKNLDWDAYAGKHIALFCSADAIIPVWAYMLVAANLQWKSKSVFYGDTETLKQNLLIQNLTNSDISEFAGKRIVIKGCGETHIPESAYVMITVRLAGIAKSVMYGEPCSTVPIIKNSIKTE